MLMTAEKGGRRTNTSNSIKRYPGEMSHSQRGEKASTSKGKLKRGGGKLNPEPRSIAKVRGWDKKVSRGYGEGSR